MPNPTRRPRRISHRRRTLAGPPGSARDQFRPKWLTGTPEELARKYDYAAEYAERIRDVRRLAKTHKKVQSGIANETFAHVQENFIR